RGPGKADARRAALYALFRRDRHQGELARVDEVGQGQIQERELQRAPAEVLRRSRADPRARGDRGRHRRPAEVAAPAVPQCVDSHTAGVEVRRLAILSSAAGVKEFKGRREDDRLLTGRGRYTADWNLPEQLYGYFLRSDHAHAEIARIDTG